MLESNYINVEPPKPPPPVPVRVSLKSQLMAALRPIVIEDHELARPFARLLRARELRVWAFGALVADTMSYAMRRSYGADIEAHWYIGRYVLPGNGEGDPQAQGAPLRLGSPGPLTLPVMSPRGR